MNYVAISIEPNLKINLLLHELSVRSTLDDVKTSIKQINTGKAPGLDGIHVELLRFVATNLLHYRLFSIVK